MRWGFATHMAPSDRVALGYFAILFVIWIGCFRIHVVSSSHMQGMFIGIRLIRVYTLTHKVREYEGCILTQDCTEIPPYVAFEPRIDSLSSVNTILLLFSFMGKEQYNQHGN